MIQTQPLEIVDFSFGITDFFIDGNVRHGKTYDNLFLDSNRKIFTRWGSETVNDQLPLGLFRVCKLSHLGDQVFAFQDKQCFRDTGAAWTAVLGPTGGNLLTAGNSQSVITDTEWREHLLFSSDAFSSIQKLYKDNTNTWRVRNAGLPELSGYSVANPPGVGSSYLYAFIVKYTYQVGTLTFTDFGPVTYYPTIVTGGAIGANTAAVTIPTTYSPVENWDQANWTVEIYRTLDAGDVYYKVGSVAFGVALFNDNIPDSTISLAETLYTTGGIYSNTTPPKAKYVHCVNDYGYYAHLKEGTEIQSTTVLQSKFGDPDSVPRGFYAETEQPITGLSSIFDRPIVLCNSYIYRIDNFFADDGSGGMLLRRIDDRAGCISAASVTQTHLGLFWAGEQGFYWSDGFRVVLISEHLPTTYQSISASSTKKKNIVGTYDPLAQRVFWTASKDDGTGEQDTIFVLDLKFPFIPEGEKRGGTFTTLSGGADPDNFKPTALLRVGKYLYRGDPRGYVFRHREGLYTDPQVNDAVSFPFEQATIIHEYASCFLDFGSKFYRKFVPRILISAANTSNLSLAIYSSNDNNRVTGTLKPIRYTSNITWGDYLPAWGDSNAQWDYQGIIEEWRRFPAGGLRCNYKQVRFTNANVILFSSDVLGQVNVDTTAKTATLTGTQTWPPDMVGYYIKFEVDNYVRQFLVTARTPTTITYEDAANEGPNVDNLYNFSIWGYPKGEVLQLNGYVIHWALISKSHTPFSASSLGSNPA